jgi:hypothetical protein
MTTIVDGSYFGYLTWTLHYLDRPAAEVLADTRQVQDALAPLRTGLLYLRQRSVADTAWNLLAVRGRGWFDRMIHRAVDSPYGRAHELDRADGFEAPIQFWSAYQAVEDRLFDDARFDKLRVDVAVGDWAAVDSTIATWLGLPSTPAVETDDRELWVGDYRVPDGSIAHVDEVDGSLRVRGLEQVWPGARLIAVGPRAFEVASLPFTIRFDADVMRVDGPELLGGQPPKRLERLT